MRVGPERTVWLREAAGPGGGEGGGVRVALGVNAGSTFVKGLWRGLGFLGRRRGQPTGSAKLLERERE